MFSRRKVFKMSDFRFKMLKKGSHEAFLTTLADAKQRSTQGQKICREGLTMINVAIFFNKQFPAKDAIDNELMKLTTHGIVQKWFNFFVNREDENFDKHFDQASSDPIVLQFDHLEGVFVIGLVGLAISCIVFGIELLYNIRVRRIVVDH